MKLDKIFKTLYKLPKAGIYALQDDANKVVFITYSRNLITSLAKNISKIQDKTHSYKHLIKHCRNIKFVFLDTINFNDTNPEIAKKLFYQIELYKQLGYKIINKHNIPKYHVKYDIDVDIRFVFVKLVTSNYKDEIIVGKFDSMQEAKEFGQIFKSMSYVIPVYAVNSLSKEFFSDRTVN